MPLPSVAILFCAIYKRVQVSKSYKSPQESICLGSTVSYYSGPCSMVRELILCLLTRIRSTSSWLGSGAALRRNLHILKCTTFLCYLFGGTKASLPLFLGVDVSRIYIYLVPQSCCQEEEKKKRRRAKSQYCRWSWRHQVSYQAPHKEFAGFWHTKLPLQ